MKKRLVMLFASLAMVAALTACGKEAEVEEVVVEIEQTAEEVTEEVAEEEAPVVEEVVTVDETDDLELIAVITAAIAAQEGTSTDGFVVRSIRRRPSNKWN